MTLTRAGTDILSALTARDELFSAHQADRLGLSPAQLRSMVDSGLVCRLARGWYAPWPVLAPADGEREVLVSAPGGPRPVAPRRHHLLRTRALVGTFAGRAMASHYSTLIAAGAPDLECDLDVVHLQYRSRGPFRRRPGHVVHVPAPPVSAVVIGGIPSVPPAVALVQTGLLSGPRAAVVAGDHLLSARVVDADGIAAALRAASGQRGIGPVAAALTRLDGRSESPGESLLRHDLQLLGYDPVPQYELRAWDRRSAATATFRADLALVTDRVLVEFDGEGKYAVRGERTRQDRRQQALEDLGWVVARFTWPDLGDLPTIRDRIEHARRRAAHLMR